MSNKISIIYEIIEIISFCNNSHQFLPISANLAFWDFPDDTSGTVRSDPQL